MSRHKKAGDRVLIPAILYSIVIIFGLTWYRLAVENSSTVGGIVILKGLVKDPKMYVMTLLTAGVLYGYFRFRSTVHHILYRWRYPIAGVIFVLCIVLEVSGTSIGMWIAYLGGKDTNTLIGTARGMRSDEWAVASPMLFSQYQNAPKAFSYFGTTLRAAKTDMFLEYGQPVHNILMFYRPFQLGYLFLPLAKGLAFYWCGRWIALFLVSFEFGMLVSDQKKRISFLYAMLLSFAPVIQWWYATNGLIEMFVYLQLSLLMLRHYLLTKKTLMRALCLIVIVICAGGFVLTFYPAWMVPLAYVIVACIIYLIIRYHKECRMTVLDYVMIGIAAVIFAASMGYLWHLSGGTIKALMNTVYPGQRVDEEGSVLKLIGNYIANPWFAIRPNNVPYANVSESAQLIDFFPICLLLPLFVSIRRRKADGMLVTFLIVEICLGLFCFLPFPALLAKVLLLSFSTTRRTFIVWQYLNVLLLIRGLSLIDGPIKRKWAVFVISIVSAIWMLCRGIKLGPDYYTPVMMGVILLVLILCFCCFFLYQSGAAKHLLTVLVIGIMLVGGLLVNPVVLGVDSIYDHPIVSAIREVRMEDPSGKWVMLNAGLPLNNLGLLAGAPTINSTNVYPELDRWRTIDPDGTQEEIYNRYAHICIQIKESGPAEFTMTYWDAFTVAMTLDDLKRIGASYFVTDQSFDGVQGITLVADAERYHIYHLDD